jgi:hypothetical protein
MAAEDQNEEINMLKMNSRYATVSRAARYQVTVRTTVPVTGPLEQVKTYLADQEKGSPEKQEGTALAFETYCQNELCSDIDAVREHARKVLENPKNKSHREALEDFTSEKSVTIRRINRFCADRTKTDLAEQIARYFMTRFTAIMRAVVFGKGDYPKHQDPYEFAKDCVGNANLQMWQGLKVLGTPAALHGWLGRIARTAYFNTIREILTRQNEKPKFISLEKQDTDEEGNQSPYFEREDVWKQAMAAVAPNYNLNYISRYWADPSNWARDIELQDLFDKGNTIHSQSRNRRDRESAFWLSVKRKDPDYPEAAIAKCRHTTVADAYHLLKEDTDKVIEIVKEHFKVDLPGYINPSL